MTPIEHTRLAYGMANANQLSGELPPPTTAPLFPVDDDPQSPLQGFAIGE